MLFRRRSRNTRALAAAGPQVARIGRARRTRYAAVREVHGLGSQWPLYRIDAHGQPHEFGQLTALHGGGCLVTPVAQPAWLQRDFAGEFADGLFPGLPWFLDDQRPQGFLGRQFAHHFAPGMGLPTDILSWDADAVLHALLQHGDDEPGNFILGGASLQRFQRSEPEAFPAAAREARYTELARKALAGGPTGSSAAGEQPKFTTCIEDDDGSLRHVIVKFSEPVDGNPAARRWADLLICEHLAEAVLAELGHPSARTELVWSGGRLCLESTRFDRIGAHGRRGFVTLAAWSDAHDGQRDDWPHAASRMQQAGWLAHTSRDQIRERWWFGQLIGNTDMHFGNLGFFLADTLPLEPAPGYDMLPMLYRPAVNGAIVPRTLDPAPPPPADLPTWRKTASWAALFWQRVAQHPGISDDFHDIAETNGAILDRLRRRFDAAVPS